MFCKKEFGKLVTHLLVVYVYCMVGMGSTPCRKLFRKPLIHTVPAFNPILTSAGGVKILYNLCKDNHNTTELKKAGHLP